MPFRRIFPGSERGSPRFGPPFLDQAKLRSVDIPFVSSDTYSTTLDYIAATQ